MGRYELLLLRFGSLGKFWMSDDALVALLLTTSLGWDVVSGRDAVSCTTSNAHLHDRLAKEVRGCIPETECATATFS